MNPLPSSWVGLGLRQPHLDELMSLKPALGFLEVHSENHFADGGASVASLEAVRAHYDISLHGVGLSLGSACGLDAAHLAQLARLVERINPVRVSDHACFARAPAHTTGLVSHASDLLPVAFTEASLNILVGHVQQAQDRLQRPILVENLTAYAAYADDVIPEVEFLTRLCQRSGCQLLLDLNNLLVNGLNHARQHTPGIGRTEALEAAQAHAMAWVRALPQHSLAQGGMVGQIHLAGFRWPDDVPGQPPALIVDDHSQRTSPTGWAIYRDTLAHLGPTPTLIEWDTDLPELAVLLDEAKLAAECLNEVLCGQEQHRQAAVLAWLQADTPQRQEAAAQQANMAASAMANPHRAYQGNAQATAARVLSNHFPTMLAMLGDEALAVLAWRLWQQHPPVSGDLGQWGAELPALIGQQPELNDWPWLADCARLDWACHTCERSADAMCDANSLQRLGDTSAKQLGLVFQPGMHLLTSPWPVVSLWHAHRLPDGDERMAAVHAAMSQGTQTAVVGRAAWQAEVTLLSAPEARWMRWWLNAGPSATLADALADMPNDVPADFDFGAWLARALSHGWLWRISVLPGA